MKRNNISTTEKKFMMGRRGWICVISAVVVLAAVVAVLAGTNPFALRASAAGDSGMLTSYNGQNSIPAQYLATNVPEGTPIVDKNGNKTTSSDGIAAFDFHIFANEFSSTVHTCGNVATNRLKGAPEFGSRANHHLDVEPLSYIKDFDAWATSTHIEDMSIVFGPTVTFHRSGQFYAKDGNVDVALGNDSGNGSITGHIYNEKDAGTFLNIADELEEAENYMRYLVWLQSNPSKGDTDVYVSSGTNDTKIFKGNSGSYNIDLSGISQSTVIIKLNETDVSKIYGTVKITGTSGKRVIFNVLDSNGDGNVKFSDTNMTADNLSNSEDSANKDNNILWNFYKMNGNVAQSVSGQVWVGGTWIGTINAPDATVECHAGLNGSIIANKVRTYCETHKSDYTGEKSKSKEITLTFHKLWKGDNGSVRPDSITVKLYRKIDSDNNSNPELYQTYIISPEDTTTCKEIDDEWTFKLENLPAANGMGNNYNYFIEELATPGYSSVVFNHNIVNTYLGIVPEFELYDLELDKLDKADSSKHLSGATFRLSSKTSGVDLSGIKVDNASNVVKTASSITWTTIDKAVKFNDMPKGVYTVTELSAPTGYKLGKPVDISLMRDTSEKLTNEAITVEISKRDSSETGDLLPGAVLKLISNDGADLKKVGTNIFCNQDTNYIIWNTGSEKLKLTGLPAGSYTLSEESAPAGYQAAAPVIFSVDANGYITLSSGSYVSEVKMVDMPAPKIVNYHDLTVYKRDSSETGSMLPGAVMTLTGGEDFSKFSKQPTVSGAAQGNGTVSGSTNSITWTTGTGAVTISDLPEGTYTLTEDSAPAGYKVAAPQTITLNSDIDDCVVVDEKITVTISKRAVGGTAELAGAYLSLGPCLPNGYDEDKADHYFDDCEILPDKVRFDANTDYGPVTWTSADTPITISGIKPGTYWLYEGAAPEGYVADTNYIYIKIAPDGKVYTISRSMDPDTIDITDSDFANTVPVSDNLVVIENEENQLRIYKQMWNDKDGNRAIISGAKLKLVYYGENSPADGIDPVWSKDFTTANEPEIFSHALDGYYVLTEDEAPEGFDKAHDICFYIEDGVLCNHNIKADTYYYSSDLGCNEDPGAQVKTEDDGSLSVYMVDKKTPMYNLKVWKSDGSGYLAGAKMAIFKYDSKNRLWDYYNTHLDEALFVFYSEKKAATFSVPEGSYALVELEAPEGYMLNKTPKVNIPVPYYKSDGITIDETVAWSITNTPTPDENVYRLFLKKEDADNGWCLVENGSMTVKVYDSKGNPISAVLENSAYEPTTGGTFVGFPRSVYKYVPSSQIINGKADGQDVVSEFKSYRGRIEIEGLPKQDYTIKEIVAPEGYEVNAKSKSAPAGCLVGETYSGGYECAIEDHHIGGSITILKKDENGTPRDGAVFKLYYSDSDNVTTGEWTQYFPDYTHNGEFTTGNGGMVTVDHVPLDKYYYFEEVKPAYGCALPEKLEDRRTEPVLVSANGIVDQFVTMEDNRTDVSIEKVDEKGQALPGAKLKLERLTNTPEYLGSSYIQYLDDTYDPTKTAPMLNNLDASIPVEDTYEINYNGNNTADAINFEYVTWTSGDEANHIYNLPAGTYRLTEVEAPAGYDISKEKVFFTIADTGEVLGADGNEITTKLITMSNVRSTGSITLTKREEADKSIRIEGAQFDLYYRKTGSSEEFVKYNTTDSYSTDENGQIFVDGLDYGYDYEFREVAPAPGYAANNTAVGTSLTAEELDKNVAAFNTRSADKVLWVVKTDGNNTNGQAKPIPGAKFKLYKRAAGSNADFEEIAGSIKVTDENGRIMYDNLAWDYDYKAVEIEPADGYKLGTDCYGEQTLEADSYAGTTFDKDKSVFVEIVNAPTSLSIKKTDGETGDCVSGATLKLVPKPGTKPDNFKFPAVMSASSTEGSVMLAFDTDRQSVTWQSTGAPVSFYSIPAGDYILSEEEAGVPAGYAWNESTVSFTIENDGTVKDEYGDEIDDAAIAISDARVPGSISVYKHVKDNEDQPLSGAEFVVYYVDDSTRKYVKDVPGDLEFTDKLSEAKKYATDDDGYMKAEDLPWGVKYFAEEVTAPAGYKLASAPISFELEASALDLTEKLPNEPFVVNIVKNDKNGNPLSGAELVIKDSGGKVYGEAWTTDGSAKVITAIPAGTYTLHENSAPAGYAAAADITFTVEGNGTVTINQVAQAGNTVTMVDDYATGSITVVKKDGNGSPLPGAKFRIYEDGTTKKYIAGISPLSFTESADAAMVFTTTAENSCTITISGLAWGMTYCAEEIEAPAGYKLNRTPISFTLTNTVLDPSEDFTNEALSVSFIKEDTAGSVLTGAQLVIKDSNGATVGEAWTTGSEAKVISPIAAGTYTLHENSAPAGYALADDIEFTVNLDGSITCSALENGVIVMEDAPTEVSIIKQITGATATPLSGASLTLTADDADADLTAAVVTGVSEYDADGNVITWTSPAAAVKFEKLPAGTYTLHEESAPTGYDEAEDIIFTVGDDGKVMIGTAEVANRTIVMLDDVSTYSISILKVDGKDAPLAGASLQVLDGEEVIDSWNSDGQPHQLTTALTEGTYTLHEVSAPTGYNTASDIEFTVTADGTIRIDGKPIDGRIIKMVDIAKTYEVKFLKKIAGENGAPLEGASLKLTAADTSANLSNVTVNGGTNGAAAAAQVTWTSGTTAVTLSNLPAGTYTLTETEAPTGYDEANDITFTIAIDGTVKVDSEVKSDRTIVMEDAVTVYSVSFSKVDGSNAALSGAELKVVDSSNAEVDSWTSDGTAYTINNLTAGRYILIETEAPTGYIKADNITFTIANDGTFTVDNEPKSDKSVTMTDNARYFELSKQTTSGTSGSTELPGASLKLTASDGIDLSKVGVTGGSDVSQTAAQITWKSADSSVKFTKLPAGTYVFSETEAPDGYKKAAAKTIVVAEDGSITVGGTPFSGKKVTMTDYARELVLSKQAVGGGDSELPNAELSITPVTSGVNFSNVELPAAAQLSDDNLTITWISGDQPLTIGIIPDGVYTFTETQAPDGYDIAETIYIKVDRSGISCAQENDYKGDNTQWTAVENDTVIMVDAVTPTTTSTTSTTSTTTTTTKPTTVVPKTYTVYVSKVELGAGDELPGAELTVTDSTGEVIDSWTSTSKKHTIEMLPAGTYTLTEVTAPDGYEVAETMKFTVTDTGVVKVNGKKVDANTVVMKDAPKELVISKQAVGGGKELEGAVLRLIPFDKDTDLSGVKVPEGVNVEKNLISWISGKEELTIGRIPDGIYEFTEITAPKGYDVAETIFIKVDEDGVSCVKASEYKDEDTKWNAVKNDTVIMYDSATVLPKEPESKTGNFSFIKRSSLNKPLSGAEFILTVGTSTKKSATGADGKVVFTDVAAGTYTLTESKAPAGYVKSAASVTVTVDNSGNVTFKDSTGKALTVTDIEKLFVNKLTPVSSSKNVTVNQKVNLLEDLVKTNDSIKDIPIKWVSSDPTIAEVDNSGNVTIKKPGQVTITAVNNNDDTVVGSFVLGAAETVQNSANTTAPTTTTANVYGNMMNVTIPAATPTTEPIVQVPSTSEQDNPNTGERVTLLILAFTAAAVTGVGAAVLFDNVAKKKGRKGNV